MSHFSHTKASRIINVKELTNENWKIIFHQENTSPATSYICEIFFKINILVEFGANFYEHKQCSINFR